MDYIQSQDPTAENRAREDLLKSVLQDNLKKEESLLNIQPLPA